jgi:hypothetical protein
VRRLTDIKDNREIQNPMYRLFGSGLSSLNMIKSMERKEMQIA